MAFTLLACSDIRAQKVNLELPFAEAPRSLDELRGVIERVFREEEVAIKRTMHLTDNRPCEPFTISRIQRYDDDALAWADVRGVDQLQPYDQLYIFRRNSTRADISPQRELPPPRLSPFFDIGVPSGMSAAAAAAERGRGRARGSVDGRDLSPRAGATAGNGLSPSAVRHAVPSYTAKATPASNALQERRNQDHHIPLYRNGTTPRGEDVERNNNNNNVDGENDGRRPLSVSQRAGLRGGNNAGGRTPAQPITSAALSSPSPYLRELTTPEQVEYLFSVADEARSGLLDSSAFAAIFRAADIRFPAEVVLDLYHSFAHKAHGEWTMTLEDFQRYAAAFPVAVSVAYQRLTNQDRAETLRQAQVESARASGNLQRQVSELEARLAAARKELAREEQKRSRIQDDLIELSRQQEPEYAREEQNVLDKEISVFRYRERLAKEERDYERLAMEQRRRSAHYALDGSNLKDLDYDADRFGPKD